MALILLLAKGYRFRHRNWQCAAGELDLVMTHRDTVVFVEVKARSGELFGGALGAVDKRKRRHMVQTAEAYLGRFGLWNRPCRFDVVTLEPGRSWLPWRIRHIPDAFQPNRGRRM